MTMHILSAFGWTVIQQQLAGDCALHDRIEFFTYGWDGSALIPIDLTPDDEPHFAAAWNQLHPRLRGVLDLEAAEATP